MDVATGDGDSEDCTPPTMTTSCGPGGQMRSTIPNALIANVVIRTRNVIPATIFTTGRRRNSFTIIHLLAAGEGAELLKTSLTSHASAHRPIFKFTQLPHGEMSRDVLVL